MAAARAAAAAAAIGVHTSCQPVLTNTCKYLLDRLERLLMHARWQRRVETLVQPLGEENLVRDDGQRIILAENLLQPQQVAYEVGPFLRSLELEKTCCCFVLELAVLRIRG